jgi:hypothetical protein
MERLLKSRRFLVLIICVVLYAVASYVPALAVHIDNIGLILTLLGGLLIGGYSVEDAVAAWSGRPLSFAAAVREMVAEVMEEWFGAANDERVVSNDKHVGDG